MSFLLPAHRVQRTPHRGLERPRQEPEESVRLRELHQSAEGTLLVRNRNIDEDARHWCLAGRTIDALLERCGRVSRLGIELLDHEVGERVAQQEPRSDVDVGVRSYLAGAPDIPLREVIRTSLQDRAALPALQRWLVQGEEDPLPIQLDCGEPIALAGDVRRNEPFATGPFEPVEHHDFLQPVDRDHIRDGVHHAPGGPCFERVRAAFPSARVVLGHEILVFREIRNLSGQSSILVRQQAGHGNRLAVQGISRVDRFDGLLDLLRRTAVVAGDLPDCSLPCKRVSRIPNSLLGSGTAVEAVGDRAPPDSRLRRNDKRGAGRCRVHPHIVDLHQGGRSIRRLRRRLAHPGLLPGARRKCDSRKRARREGGACAASWTGAEHSAVDSRLIQLQVRLSPVGTALTLLRPASVPVDQVMPGNVRQVAIFVHEDPRRLLQPAATLAATVGFVFTRWRTVLFVTDCRPRSPPRRAMHQAAPQAPHPCREPQRRNPPDHRPVALGRPRRCAQRASNAENAPNPVHVADLASHGVTARAIPGPDVLHHHQTVRTTHDGTHRAVAQQVREPNRDVFLSHETQFSNVRRRSFRFHHVRPMRRHLGGQSWTLNAPMPSTFRIEFRVAHRPRRDSPCV